MSFLVLLHPKANEFLERGGKRLEERIRKKLRVLGEDPESGERLKPTNFWRLRIGDYRAIYEVDYEGERVMVLFIGHRKKVYDDFSRLL